MIKNLIRSNAEIVEKALEGYMDINGYGIEKSMAYSLLSGGKRIRPFIVLETYKMFSKDGSIEKEMSVFYKGLIEMRKAFHILSDIDAYVSGEAIGDDGKAYISISDNDGNEAFILLNPTAAVMTFGLDKSWNMICNGESAGKDVIGVVDHEVTIPSYSAVVLVNDKVLNK
jgi:geranylgeranyl pyrophosphate synthase